LVSLILRDSKSQAALVEPEQDENEGSLDDSSSEKSQAALVEPEPYSARGATAPEPTIQAYFVLVVGSQVETVTRPADAVLLQNSVSCKNKPF